MKRHIAAAVVVCGALGAGAGVARGQEALPDREYALDAPALSAIKIDGDLADWPAAIPRYAVRNLLGFPPLYGKGGLEKADLTTSPDLSAAFSVGYDPKAQLLYVAVTVRDDALVVGHKTAFDTDAVEVFVDGNRAETRIPNPPGKWEDSITAAEMPVLQYVGTPGPPDGRVYGWKQPGNPALMYGEISKTKTKMATSRKGDMTVYEWAVQVFDHYPDKPTELGPGKRIGFDLAVVDRDKAAPEGGLETPEADRPVWVVWGREPNGFKGFCADNLGELVLGKAPE